MFQIRAEQYAAMRRKKLGDALIQGVSPLQLTGRWDEEGVTVLLEDALKNRSRIGFDRMGFIDRFTSPLGRTWQFSNLPDGKPAAMKGPSGARVEMKYSPDGDLAAVVSTARQPTYLLYTQQHQLAGLTFPDKTWESIEYTPWGAPARVIDRLGSQTLLRYDQQRRPTEIKDGNGNSTSLHYANRTLADSMRFPNGSSESYTYGPDGHISGIVQGDVSIRIKCNSKGRPLLLQYSDGTDVEYEYDDQDNIAKGRVGDLVTEIARNDQGRVLEEVTGGLGHKFNYDAVGRLVGMEASSGEVARYAWDADSQLTGFTDWNGGRHSIEYAAADLGFVTTGANQVRSVTRVGPAGKIESVEVTAHGNSLFSLECGYNKDALLEASRDSVGGERAFSYDAKGHLIRAVASTGNRESFSYDRAGNLTQINGAAAKLDAANQLLAIGHEELSYDLRGNLIRHSGPSGIRTFAYNARNQMISSTSPEGVETLYSYDAFNRRVMKRSGSREIRFVWACELLVAEIITDHASGTVARRDFLYFPGTCTPLASRVDGKVYSYHTDHVGVPRAMTSEDGRLVWVAKYSSFGDAEVDGSVQSPLRFPGQYFDEETGFCYNRFRYYAPRWGRYITRDPMGLLAGLNLYAYADNDPVNGSDPFGLLAKAFWVLGGVLATAAVVAVAAVAIGPTLAIGGLALGAVGTSLLVGTVGGALVAAMGEGINTYLDTGHVCWPCVAKAAGIGAAVGFLGTGLALLAPGLAPLAVGFRAISGGALGYANYEANLATHPGTAPSNLARDIYIGVSALTLALTGTNLVGSGPAEEEVTDSVESFLSPVKNLSLGKDLAEVANIGIDNVASAVNSAADTSADLSTEGPAKEFATSPSESLRPSYSPPEDALLDSSTEPLGPFAGPTPSPFPGPTSGGAASPLPGSTPAIYPSPTPEPTPEGGPSPSPGTTSQPSTAPLGDYPVRPE